jgi:hypothetical protein
MHRHAFTVGEANALLPLARATLRRVRAAAEAARRRADRIAVLGVLWGEDVRRTAHADHPEYRAHRSAIDRIRRRVERLVEERFTARGVRFPPGGIEHGLLDFPTTLDGRWVYLCWRMGEERVGYWHEADAGFAGRRAITDDEAARMGPPPGPAKPWGPH